MASSSILLRDESSLPRDTAAGVGVWRNWAAIDRHQPDRSIRHAIAPGRPITGPAAADPLMRLHGSQGLYDEPRASVDVEHLFAGRECDRRVNPKPAGAVAGLDVGAFHSRVSRG